MTIFFHLHPWVCFEPPKVMLPPVRTDLFAAQRIDRLAILVTTEALARSLLFQVANLLFDAPTLARRTRMYLGSESVLVRGREPLQYGTVLEQ